ncbi:MAG: DNA polymerase III subunit gamma/tau [Bacteroidales bacterium]|nr:DNA polymerase III subunit gamma/tau [Bacteroidales bacterium]
MENFIVSARKYRPVTFASVVGQQSITTTLKNAVKNNKLAQAFLFTGPRGVGKTTCARILAKTINCQHPTDDLEPCNECESCRSFNNNASFNIYELDAASNNSVDDIRALVDQVRIPPQSGKYKVYIIDEVHMLSTQAFNAFLKTLEEPPAYAKFILATTEKHKIIPTILSRCQIFDFKRIYLSDIVAHLKYVADKEGVTYEESALHIIAQKADGALRDALSIFDQVVNYAGTHLSYKQVIENLNVLDYEYYFKIIDAALQNRYADCLMILNNIIDNGFDGQYFIVGLGEHLRTLLVCKATETIQLMEVSDDVKQRYARQAARCSLSFLQKALDLNNTCDLNYKSVANKRLLIELFLLKISMINITETNSSATVSIQNSSTPTASSTATSIKTPSSIAPNSEVKVESTTDKTSSAIKQQTTPSATTYPSSQSSDSLTAQEPNNINPSNYQSSTTTVPKSIHAFSMSKIVQEKQESLKNVPQEKEVVIDHPFSQSDLNNIWESMANSMKTEMLKMAFKARNPILIDPHTIVIELDNKFLIEECHSILPHLKMYLFKKLNNNQIKIELRQLEQDTMEKVPYTDAEVIKEMAKKNENVIDFMNKMDLKLM